MMVLRHVRVNEQKTFVLSQRTFESTSPFSILGKITVLLLLTSNFSRKSLSGKKQVCIYLPSLKKHKTNFQFCEILLWCFVVDFNDFFLFSRLG